jgi:hypothetical protein
MHKDYTQNILLLLFFHKGVIEFVGACRQAANPLAGFICIVDK